MPYTLMRASLFTLLLCVSSAIRPGSALQLTPPPTWRWVTDSPARAVSTPDKVPDSAFTFVQMPPGWHITMGPGGLLFDGEYGFFVGGTELDGSGARYVSFSVRGDGAVAAWERRGGATRKLSEWRRAEAVIPTDGQGIVRNLLRLVVSKLDVVFRANGLDVLILPRESIPLDGQFGFRVGAGVNLHITTLDVTHRLAPTRP